MKKFLFAALVTFSLSTTALAQEMVTVNNTDQASTVKLLTGMFEGYCATEIPFGEDAYTPAHSTKHFPWTTISVICSHAFPCQAEIFVGDSVSCLQSEGDVSLGKATLFEDGSINIDSFESDKYFLTIDGNTLILNQK